MTDVDLGLGLQRLTTLPDWKYLKKFLQIEIDTYTGLGMESVDEEERKKSRTIYLYVKNEFLEKINEHIESALSVIEENKREEAK